MAAFNPQLSNATSVKSEEADRESVEPKTLNITAATANPRLFHLAMVVTVGQMVARSYC